MLSKRLESIIEDKFIILYICLDLEKTHSTIDQVHRLIDQVEKVLKEKRKVCSEV